MTRLQPLLDERRQFLHVALGSGALLFRYIRWWEAIVLVACGVAFAMYALPRLRAPSGGRVLDSGREIFAPRVLYPLSILLLLLILPDRLDIVAAAWGILAAGDGMATLAGRRIRTPRVPWNREKSLGGTAAFVVCGGAAGALLCWWCRPPIVPPPYLWFSIGAPLLAALVAAGVETLPVRLPDNLSVPLTAAAVLWTVSMVNEDLAAHALRTALPLLPLAAAATGALASIGYAAGAVTRSGAWCGTAIGILFVVATGWAGWLLLLATFAAAVIASRAGLARKSLLGIAEPRGGRRGAANAVANTGVAAAAALLSTMTYAADAALIACVAALVAGSSDTIASEIGKAFGGRTRLASTWTSVRPGTPGAVSLEGTAAGVFGAAALAWIAVSLGLVPASALRAIVVGATLGSFAESLMAATLEGPGVLNNHLLNFLNTAIAAITAVALAGLL